MFDVLDDLEVAIDKVAASEARLDVERLSRLAERVEFQRLRAVSAFERSGAQVLAISCDSRHSQRTWAEQQGFTFPVLTDFWPHGAVAKAYGVFNEALGCANRATFVLDADGVVRSTFSSADLGTPRAKTEYEAALANVG